MPTAANNVPIVDADKVPADVRVLANSGGKPGPWKSATVARKVAADWTERTGRATQVVRTERTTPGGVVKMHTATEAAAR